MSARDDWKKHARPGDRQPFKTRGWDDEFVAQYEAPSPTWAVVTIQGTRVAPDDEPPGYSRRRPT